MDMVEADGNRFSLETVNFGPEHVVQRREITHSHVDALDVIGRETDRENIMKLLMQP
ncbi:NBS-LRR disease resistance protein, partial [Trifolium medium]|nr:NBS-LRR disease resistance protein [Trifolium medium]